MYDTPTEAVKDARQRRFDAPVIRRHAAMKKFSAGALVAATLAGSVGCAVPANAGTTTTTTVATTTTTLATTTSTLATTTTTLASSSCGVDDGSAFYIDCVRQLASQTACPDLGMTMASMTPFFDFSFQLSGDWNNSGPPRVVTGCTLAPPHVVGNYVPNQPESYVVDITAWSLLEAEKAYRWAITTGLVKTHIGNGGKTYILTHSIGGFGPGAEYAYSVGLVNPKQPHGKVGIPSNSYSLITPVGNGVLMIEGGPVPASLAVFLSYAKLIYQAAVVNA